MKEFTDHEIIDIDNTKVQMAIVDVEDTTNIFDALDGVVQPKSVPGHPRMNYIPWGSDDKLPYEVRNRIGTDEVTSQNMLFNALTCYGGGVEMVDSETKQPTANAIIQDWMDDNDLASYFLESAVDMKYFYFTVSLVVLSRDYQSINAIYHKDACHCRLEEADKRGMINHVFIGDWSQGDPEKVQIYPLLDLHHPFKDLMQRVGRAPGRDGLQKVRTNKHVFAIIRRFPTVGCQYYPLPYYTSIFKGGSYDEKRMISEGKRAKLRNHMAVKYLVEVNHDYWNRICEEAGITDEEEMQKRVKEEKEKIRDFVAGINNSGKAWISGFMDDGEGHIVSDIKITNLEAGKEGGDWQGDLESASNTLCYATNVHPNLVGSTPGKSQMNNSGSDKRELFTMKQAMEKPYHDVMLSPLVLVCRYNNWKVRPSVPFLMLTTLDEHKDAKKVDDHGNA